VIIAKRKLGRATLTVAVLVVFFVLTLSALFLLVLAGLPALLTGLATLLTLSRLTALLALSELVTLLTLFLHIVCHEIFLLKKRRLSHAPKINRHLRLSCCNRLQRLGNCSRKLGPERLVDQRCHLKSERPSSRGNLSFAEGRPLLQLDLQQSRPRHCLVA
jgi:hypothetical protein